MKIAVSEVFYSIQGEGKTTGYPAVFLRLAGCNLMCGGQGTQFDGELHNGATWRCDTIEVWMKGTAVEFDKVFNEECIEALTNGAHLVVTGGEPLMHQNQLEEFLIYCKEKFPYLYVEIETNGTQMVSDALDGMIDQYNVSPKLSNSGNSRSQRIVKDALKRLKSKNTIFKFVISDYSDWQEIQEDFIPIIGKKKIWLMPAGENQELLNQTKILTVEIAKENHLKFTNRLHIEIWNKKTGV